MKVGYAGPIAFDMLEPYVRPADRGRYSGTQFPQGSLLASKLIELGHHVFVYTLDHEQRASGPLTLYGDSLTVHILPYRTRLRWIDGFRAEIHSLRRVMTNDQPDVIHAQWSYEYALAAISSGLPNVVTVRDWAPYIFSMQRKPLEFVYRLVRWGMNRRALRRAHRLTVTSPYMRGLVRRYVGREPDLVPNALGGEVFGWNPTTASEREPRIVSINNGFDRRKNVDTLLEAFAGVRRRHPDSELRLIGSGYDVGGPAHTWATERRLAESVVFEGVVPFETVLETLRSARVLAHPSREESFGGTLLEAMACGAPVIGGRESGAVPWVLDDGAAGILVDIEDPGALENAICAVLEEPDTADDLASAGLARARDFDLDSTSRKYLAAYRKTITTFPAAT